jgi:hypothetical protein
MPAMVLLAETLQIWVGYNQPLEYHMGWGNIFFCPLCLWTNIYPQLQWHLLAETLQIQVGYGQLLEYLVCHGYKFFCPLCLITPSDPSCHLSGNQSHNKQTLSPFTTNSGHNHRELPWCLLPEKHPCITWGDNDPHLDP